MSLINELKRRNVFRVGAAYAVVSWLVLQVADVVLNNVEAPGWVFHAILLILGIGFLIVLVFAWAFELTPEGIRREKDVDRSQSITSQTGRKLDRTIIVVLVLALAYFAYDKFAGAPPAVPTAAESATQSGPAAAEDRKSVAVLPFANMSGDPANDPFTLGIHDDLLTHLSRISALRTISRTSVLQYRDTTKTIPQIASELGVAAILEGGIQRSGNHVRINVQLIDAKTDEHLWAEIYDRELTAENLFAVQGEIATEVAQSLQATLLPAEQSALAEVPTQSMAAYDLYLLGRHHWDMRTAESIDLAREYFAQAIAEDPNYVLALSGLADAYILAANYGNLEESEAIPMAEDAIGRAMELDDARSEVWASLGLLRQVQIRYPESREALEKAIDLDPKNYSAWLWYANSFGATRHYREQLAALETAYSLEPMSKPVNQNLAFSYQYRGNFPASRLHFERLDEIDDLDVTRWQVEIARTWLDSGEIARATEQLRRVVARDPRNLEALGLLSDAALLLGDMADAERWSQEVARIAALSMQQYGVLLAGGRFEDAVVYVEDALAKRGQRQEPWILLMAFRAAMYGGQVESAKAYLAEALGMFGGRVEINPGNTAHNTQLTVAGFLLEYGDPSNGGAQRGQEMVEEILAGLDNLVAQDYGHPNTWYSLARARQLAGDAESALDALEQAVAAGFRDRTRLAIEPELAPLNGHPRWNALLANIDQRLQAQREQLAGMTLEAFTPYEERPRIALSREQLEGYVGNYTDENVVIRMTIDERGQLIARPGQRITFHMIPTAEDTFYPDLVPANTIRFVRGEDGEITHAEAEGGGNITRFKVTGPQPQGVVLDREVLERYVGVYAAQRREGQEQTADTDIWAVQISVDETGRVWADFDDQPALEIVPYSETEFFLPGFMGKYRFEVDGGSDKAARMIQLGGWALVFERQE